MEMCGIWVLNCPSFAPSTPSDIVYCTFTRTVMYTSVWSLHPTVLNIKVDPEVLFLCISRTEVAAHDHYRGVFKSQNQGIRGRDRALAEILWLR